ncbi:chitin binding domain-containing [Micractinium conductrix]|uniref:Chitin binding domain-containing n=1 Tax=Micractinium conductrix TaxID=554055 RepID=A0A2P6V015_9CHLO|nr:chitin binding domain-containing [Micractinium conductrix]|eukprot:PSC67430.1 chitin binding domain-containing [Micractinium conductrix]
MQHRLTSVTRLPALAMLAVALASALPRAAAHGFIAEPKSRNYVRNWQYCPHCVSAGGSWPVSGEGRLTWPMYDAPVCGAADLSDAGAPVQSYARGGVIDITIFITAQHGGRHEFHLCPSPHVSKGCLKEHQLERVDGEGPDSWTPASGGPAPGGRWKHDILASQGGDSYTWRYRLPAGVSCDRCVLQWRWTTANSCRVPGAPSWVGSDPGMLSCTEPGPYPEQFFNCADIRIGTHGSDGESEAGGQDSSSHSSGGSSKKAKALAQREEQEQEHRQAARRQRQEEERRRQGRAGGKWRSSRARKAARARTALRLRRAMRARKAMRARRQAALAKQRRARRSRRGGRH